MKKLLTSILAASLMLTALAGCGGTATKTDTNAVSETTASDNGSDWEYIQSKGKLTIGYTLFAPMNYMDNGELVGFETDFAKAVCEKLGVEPDFQEINWDSKEIELNSKNIDCIWNGMTVTPEREQTMSLSKHYMENRQVIVTKAENKDKVAANVDGLSGLAEAGSTGEELIQGDEFFKNVKYTAVDSQAKAFMDVSSGTSDFAVCDYTMAVGSLGEGTDYTDLVMIDNNYESQDYAIAFRKGADTVEKVNAVIDELTADGTMAQIAEKYKMTDLLLLK